jgi:hypothetical protein
MVFTVYKNHGGENVKFTTKAALLILLCLFAALAAPIATCFASGPSPKGTYALTLLTPTADTQGDPIDTPGGGGMV